MFVLKKTQRRKKFETLHRQQRKPGKTTPLQQEYEDTKQRFSNVTTLPASTLYDCRELMDCPPTENETAAQVLIENQDTIEMALYFCSQHLNPLVLNMASDFCPGGGVKSGKMAQEECLFRCTNAFMTHPPKWYPLEKMQVIYSPEVRIVKNSSFEVLTDQAKIGMIAVPAVRKPKLRVDGTYCERDHDLMRQKIEAIFKIAILHKHDSLVLGSLGCGVFNNPPEQVADMFQEMLRKYAAHFKVIGFAVLVAKEKDRENLRVFCERINVG